MSLPDVKRAHRESRQREANGADQMECLKTLKSVLLWIFLSVTAYSTGCLLYSYIDAEHADAQTREKNLGLSAAVMTLGIIGAITINFL